MSKFKKGDEVIGGDDGELYTIFDTRQDIYGNIVCRDEDGGYSIAHPDHLTLNVKTQNWFGIEIDAFDTELPGEVQKYYFYSVCTDSYEWLYFGGDASDHKVMAAGYWLDEEKAKRSAPKMHKRMCEMAKGE